MHTPFDETTHSANMLLVNPIDGFVNSQDIQFGQHKFQWNVDASVLFLTYEPKIFTINVSLT